MQKAEPQYGHEQNRPAAKQGGGLAVESSQRQRIAPLAALADNSTQVETQAQLAALINGSPSMAARRKLIESVHTSPRQIAQRTKLDTLFGTAQRMEEEPLQGKFETAQRAKEEEPIQHKFSPDAPAQLEQQPAPRPNNTGLPDNLKSGIENLSGISMDNVKVHFNSSRPAQLNALAYAQGTDIHVAPGQEHHLPHEAWHVVQQAQGRVRPTMQMKDGVPVNDDRGLEREADVMGDRAMQMRFGQTAMPGFVTVNRGVGGNPPLVQRWSEEEVYSVIRESIPAWKKRTEQIEAEENISEKRYLAKPLIQELDKAINDSHNVPPNGYRLGRTWEFAEGAVNAIEQLKARVENGAKSLVYDAIDEHERLEAEVSECYRQMCDKAKELGVNHQAPEVDNEVKERAVKAKQVILTTMEPDSNILIEFNDWLRAELKAYDQELERLKRVEDNQPKLEELDDAFMKERDCMNLLIEWLGEIIYKKRILNKKFEDGNYENLSGNFRKRAAQVRTLSNPEDVAQLPNLILEIRSFIEQVEKLGVEVQEAHERLQTSGSGSRTARQIKWQHTTRVARISEKAYDGLISVGCREDNIRTALGVLKNAALGEWNVIKDLGKGVYELKVQGAGKYRCEGKSGDSGLIEFKNAPKKGTGK